jgi:hypothetical protein
MKLFVVKKVLKISVIASAKHFLLYAFSVLFIFCLKIFHFNSELTTFGRENEMYKIKFKDRFLSLHQILRVKQMSGYQEDTQFNYTNSFCLNLLFHVLPYTIHVILLTFTCTSV